MPSTLSIFQLFMSRISCFSSAKLWRISPIFYSTIRLESPVEKKKIFLSWSSSRKRPAFIIFKMINGHIFSDSTIINILFSNISKYFPYIFFLILIPSNIPLMDDSSIHRPPLIMKSIQKRFLHDILRQKDLATFPTEVYIVFEESWLYLT